VPLLAFTNEDLRRVTFYAQLNQTLEANSERLFGRSAEDVAGTRQDRRRLGVYYVVDWILRQGKIEFTVSDLLHASRHLSSRIALAEEIAVGAISELLGVLTVADYIEQVGEKLDEVALGRAQSDAEPRYRLTARRLAEMAGLATVFEEEAAILPARKNTSAASSKSVIEVMAWAVMGCNEMVHQVRPHDCRMQTAREQPGISNHLGCHGKWHPFKCIELPRYVRFKDEQLSAGLGNAKSLGNRASRTSCPQRRPPLASL
jgi:hypothetical protein